jgi:tetratricopeptide (TPR) repeat protein/predicted Ser/Thr protein kinase
MQPGQTLRHYRLVEKIGEGGMGVVWKALDTTLDREVAIKILPDAFQQDPEKLTRLEREAKLLASLNHPNVATIHGLHKDDGVWFLAMELIEGRTLRSAMGDGLSVEESIDVTVQVARALSVAHESDIVHRDLKPDNIMIRNDGYVKVLDFGLASLVQVSNRGPDTMTVTVTGGIVGTVPYMSPEQCRGTKITSASDIFSLGVVLYELATGRHPFREKSAVACMGRIVSETPITPSRLNPAVSKELETLILDMLKKEPGLRPDAREVTYRMAERKGRHGGREKRAEQEEPIPSMVGRAEQEASMLELFRTAASGHGRLVCVTGEPGIGKTTLVEGFLRGLTADGESCFVARGRCSERLAGTEAYLPLLEALENLLRGPHEDQVSRVMKVVAPSWYFRTAPLASDDSSGASLREDAKASSQERMKRELIAFLEELSRTAPVILFFDDVHWADVSTVDFLAYIGARGDGLQLLTVATYRPSDLLLSDHPFVGVKRELQARGACREIALGFLSTEDIAGYLSLEFPGHTFPDEFAEFVHTKTEGNALFMVNLIRYLRDVKAIAERDGWRLVRPLSKIEKEMPESIRSMIERKIDQMEDADRRLLVAASVQGAEFHASIVAEAVAEDEVDVEERLERLDRLHAFVRLLEEEEFPDGSLTVRYSFVHALYQDALYGKLTPARRAAQSAAVARAWVRRRGHDTSPVANELGVLFEAARDFGQASDYFLQAADKASRVYANQEAIELCQRSIRNAEKLPEDERYTRIHTAALHLAILHLTISRFEEATEFFDQAERAAEAAGDTEARIQAICGRGMMFLLLRRLDEMRGEGKRAAELARSVDSGVGVASAEMVLASERLCLGELQKAELLFSRSIPILQSAGLRAEAVQAVVLSGALHTWRLEYDDAHRIYMVALNKARELGSTFDIVGAHFFNGMALGNQGRLGEALAALTEGRRVAELNREQYWLPRLPNTFAWLHMELGDMETSLGLNLECVELAREFSMAEGEANAHVNLAGIYVELAESDSAREHLRCAARLYEGDVWFRWRYNIRWHAEYARYWIARGDLAAARNSAEACQTAATKHQARKYLAWSQKILGEIALLEDDVEAATLHFDESLRILSKYPCPTIEWKILRMRGDAALRVGDDAARDRFRGRARSVVSRLAESVPDEGLRERFLRSKAVRDL